MSTEHIKIFTGSPINANRLQSLLKEIQIDSLIKNQVESARLAGFGSSYDSAAEVYILNIDLDKAKETIENYLEEINA